MKNNCSLFLESSSGYVIKNQNGKVVSIEEAKRLYSAGLVLEWNFAFDRLVQFSFNIDALKAYYTRLETV